MVGYYDRYQHFRVGGKIQTVPFVKITKEISDIYIIYKKNEMRFDNLSYKYYGDANYAWLILQANPELGGYEFSINDGVEIRIPYPLSDALERYENSVREYKHLSGKS